MNSTIRRLLLPVFFLTAVFSGASAQMNIIAVSPDSTGQGIRVVHGEHFAYSSGSVPSRHRLVLMIQGTGTAAKDFSFFDTTIASMGFPVISLDYENNIITTTCSNSKDSSCFNGFRQEIVFGTPVSSVVDVDSVNSIYHRLQQFMFWLVQHYPQQGWDEYIKDSTIQWEKIVVGGHSQGAGHAAYLGKRFKVDRVLIFSGPQDYLSYYHTPASWLSDSSQTGLSRYFAFLHTQDPYDFLKQRINCETLMQLKNTDQVPAGEPDTLMVAPDSPIKRGKHIMVTDIPGGNPHGSTLDPRFRQVFEYMLEEDDESAPAGKGN
ncbi:MAG TPA: hypothetical protein VK563_14935 [Puia sp.]|nr:hypothetical protein [Puia sp.]